MDIITLILILLQTKGVGQASQPDVPLSVCEVLADDPTRLNGNVVKIRGLLDSTDEGNWIFDECKTHLETKGLVWGNNIAVTLDESNEDSQRAWNRLREKLRQLHPDWSSDRIRVTFVGRLTTRRTMDEAVVEMPYGLVKAGFGHLSGSPAEIEVLSVENITVERRPTNNSRK